MVDAETRATLPVGGVLSKREASDVLFPRPSTNRTTAPSTAPFLVTRAPHQPRRRFAGSRSLIATATVSSPRVIQTRASGQ